MKSFEESPTFWDGSSSTKGQRGDGGISGFYTMSFICVCVCVCVYTHNKK